MFRPVLGRVRGSVFACLALCFVIGVVAALPAAAVQPSNFETTVRLDCAHGANANASVFIFGTTGDVIAGDTLTCSNGGRDSVAFVTGEPTGFDGAGDAQRDAESCASGINGDVFPARFTCDDPATGKTLMTVVVSKPRPTS